MQRAEPILQAMRQLGTKGLPLTRVYRCLYSEDLMLAAYDKIGGNQGALTPGPDPDTADGMSRNRIQRIIDQLRTERFHFRPVRRTEVPKKKGGTRPLGLPNFSDKLVQEAVRSLLVAYYEPRFRDSSHGFRSGRGCHTALAQIQRTFTGTIWFIEGDIKGCFSNLDHQILLDLLAQDIHDGRLLNLIDRNLKAGYLEAWRYHHTYSGVPQGATLSPLLANRYLHELDRFVEDTLIPQYTHGQSRASNLHYRRISHRLKRARQQGDKALIQQLEQQRRQLPSQAPNDPNYRRLRYIRYADDFALGFIGPKTEAETIKQTIGEFLRDKLHLELNQDKTLITHARTDHAHFLGYAISVQHANHKLTPRLGTSVKARSINGTIRLGLPAGLVDQHCQRYQRKGKPSHEPALLFNSAADIIHTYQQRFRGLAEYYKYAIDRTKLGQLKYVMEIALTKTLAAKFKTSVAQIYRRYHATLTVQGHTYKTLQVEVPTHNGTRRVYWGAIPLQVVKVGTAPLNEQPPPPNPTTHRRSDLIQRLQANQCELCGSTTDCQVHHVRKLADLKRRWRGRKAKPPWVKQMIALQRKTLVVCRRCHSLIHSGSPLPNPA